MPELITNPVVVPAAGTPPKTITEFVGNASTGDGRVSVALMQSPPGWAEPPQRPEFDEFTVVLSGRVVVDHDGGQLTVEPGQAVHARPGGRGADSTPDGAQDGAGGPPALTPGTGHPE